MAPSIDGPVYKEPGLETNPPALSKPGIQYPFENFEKIQNENFENFNQDLASTRALGRPGSLKLKSRCTLFENSKIFENSESRKIEVRKIPGK